MTAPNIDPTARLFKLATPKDNEIAKQALNESHMSIDFYYSLKQEDFNQLKPELQGALNSLRKLHEYGDLVQKTFYNSTPSIPVEVFAKRYYRWLRGESVPQHVLISFKMTESEYLTMLFNEWCSNVGRATVPVFVDDEQGNHIYLLPPLHCRDMISVKEQVGFVTQGPDGERFSPSGGAINDNFKKIDLLQNESQKAYAMKKLFDNTVSVNGTKDDSVSVWSQAWKDTIIYFDKAFGITDPINNEQVKPVETKVEKVETGYKGKMSDYF